MYTNGGTAGCLGTPRRFAICVGKECADCFNLASLAHAAILEEQVRQLTRLQN